MNRIFEAQNALGLNTSTSLNIDKEKSTITIDINTVLIDNQKEEVLVEHSGRTVYVVKGLDIAYNEDDNNFTDLGTCLILVFIYFLRKLASLWLFIFTAESQRNAKLYDFTKNKHIKHYESIYQKY